MHSFRDGFDARYVLAWVNSKLFQYSFECFFDGLKMQGGYLLYSAPNLLKMSIMKVSNEIQLLFQNIVNEIHSNGNSTFELLINRIDLMFYKLYDLTYDECQMIDPSIEKHISQKDYERASIEELAKY